MDDKILAALRPRVPPHGTDLQVLRLGLLGFQERPAGPT